MGVSWLFTVTVSAGPSSTSLIVSVWITSRPAEVVVSCFTAVCSTSRAMFVPIGVTLTPPDGAKKDGNPKHPPSKRGKHMTNPLTML